PSVTAEAALPIPQKGNIPRCSGCRGLGVGVATSASVTRGTSSPGQFRPGWRLHLYSLGTARSNPLGRRSLVLIRTFRRTTVEKPPGLVWYKLFRGWVFSPI